MVEGGGGHNGDEHQPKERRKQGEAPVHWLEQLIEDERHDGIASETDQISRPTKTVQRLVRQNVGRCSRGVATHKNPAAHEDLGESAGGAGDQVQHAGDSGLETRRRFCNPFHHFIASRRGRRMNVATPNIPTPWASSWTYTK